MVVRTPVLGYTSGQTINVLLEVDNKSEIEVELKVQLMRVRLPSPVSIYDSIEFSFQVSTFYTSSARTNRRTQNVAICGPSRIGCSRELSYELYRTTLVIPPTPPTDSESSNLIKVRYVLQVSEESSVRMNVMRICIFIRILYLFWQPAPLSSIFSLVFGVILGSRRCKRHS